MVAMETKVCQVINIGTSFQKKLNRRVLVQAEHGFQMEHNVPLDLAAPKKPCLNREIKEPSLDKIRYVTEV